MQNMSLQRWSPSAGFLLMWAVLVCSILFRGGHAAPGIVDVCSSMPLVCRQGVYEIQGFFEMVVCALNPNPKP